ncbi:MAG TPA: zinc ribbon domain-containing protein [Acidobacteriota bacterium]|nr:zinc ribbon domain-containing protein [Acidobacteriota bacterium]HQM62213.1 zinc ribbon domain-containing protein [Acidobacteriota bacterium]
MPIYEYVCTVCNHRFEKIQKFSDPPVTDCPDCGQRVELAPSAPAIQFKGSGWYITDYAHKSSPASSGDRKETTDKKSDSPSKSNTPEKTA